MVQRLAIIGFVIAVIVAVFAFVQQQQTVNQVRVAQTAQAVAESEGATAIAQAGAASDAQSQAEARRDTAVDDARSAGTAAAQAQATAAAAVDQANLSGTAQAAGAATAGAQVADAQATAGAESDARATTEAESESRLATANAQVAAAETQEAFYLAAIATATAQVDLANFAAQSAEEDRASALDAAHTAATQIAQLESDLAAAQLQLEGQPPAPTQSGEAPPTPTAAPLVETPVPQPDDPTALITFSTADDFISFDHPASWVVAETDQGYISITSDQSVLTREDPALGAGQMEASLYFVLGSNVTRTEQPPTLEEVTTLLRDSLTEGEDAAFTYGDITEVSVGGFQAMRTEGTVIGNDTLLLVIDLGNDVFVILLAIVAEGELPQFEPQYVSMIASLRVNVE